MPTLQQIYGAFTQWRFAGPAVDALYNDIYSLGAVVAEKAKYRRCLLKKLLVLKT